MSSKIKYNNQIEELKTLNNLLALREVEYEDVLSQRLHEWIEFREKCRIQDDTRTKLIQLKRNLKQLEMECRQLTAIVRDVNVQTDEMNAEMECYLAKLSNEKNILQQCQETLRNAKETKVDY